MGATLGKRRGKSYSFGDKKAAAGGSLQELPTSGAAAATLDGTATLPPGAEGIKKPKAKRSFSAAGKFMNFRKKKAEAKKVSFNSLPLPPYSPLPILLFSPQSSSIARLLVYLLIFYLFSFHAS